jgi:hypothetical protein
MMAWSKAIARPVLRVAQDLRAASHEASFGKERQCWRWGLNMIKQQQSGYNL